MPVRGLDGIEECVVQLALFGGPGAAFHPVWELGVDVYAWPLRMIRLPRTPGFPPNLVFHKVEVTSATGGAPNRSSASVNVLPTIGLMPSTAKSPAEAMAAAQAFGVALAGETEVVQAIGGHLLEGSAALPPVVLSREPLVYTPPT